MKCHKRQATKRTRKKKSPSKSTTKSIPAKVVKEIESSNDFARIIGLDLNQFVTIVHEDIDTLDPEAKKKRHEADLNRLKQYARDNNFDTAFVWSRESERQTGNREHLHVRIHIPPEFQNSFKRVVERWPADVDIRKASYTKRLLPSGKTKSDIGYLLKNSPQAAWGTSRMFQLGGPIVGKRCGCSRNINMNSQEIHRYGKKLFKQVSQKQTDEQPLP